MDGEQYALVAGEVLRHGRALSEVVVIAVSCQLSRATTIRLVVASVQSGYDRLKSRARIPGGIEQFRF